MKIRRTNSFGEPPRRRSPMPMGCIVLAIALVVALGWIWHQGGEKLLSPVEKPIAADKLGH